MPYVVAQPCVDVKDKACVDECPVDCIYEGSRSLYINPNECVDCGACEPVCPTEAIFYEDDLPDEWAWYKDAAVSFFAEVGDMGGASAAGPIGKDPEQVAALPAQNQCSAFESGLFPLEEAAYFLFIEDYKEFSRWAFMSFLRHTIGRVSQHTSARQKPRSEA